MDSQTITLVLGAIVVLVIVNFLFMDESAGSGNTTNRRTPVRVTPDMIEAVRSIAPGLTTSQIRADLQITGSVQVTVEKYLSGGLVVSESDEHDNYTPGVETPKNENISGIGSDTFAGLSFEEKKREMILLNREKFMKKNDIRL